MEDVELDTEFECETEDSLNPITLGEHKEVRDTLDSPQYVVDDPPASHGSPRMDLPAADMEKEEEAPGGAGLEERLPGSLKDAKVHVDSSIKFLVGPSKANPEADDRRNTKGLLKEEGHATAHEGFDRVARVVALEERERYSHY